MAALLYPGGLQAQGPRSGPPWDTEKSTGEVEAVERHAGYALAVVST